MVQDVNEFAPKWNIRSEDIANEPLHTLTTGVAIEEGQLFEEVSAKIRKKVQYKGTAMFASMVKINI